MVGLKIKIILLFFIINSTYALELKEEKIFLNFPEGWSIEKGTYPVLIVSKSSKATPNPGNSQIPEFYTNIVITKQEMTGGQLALYKKNPVFYLEVILFQSYPNIKISTSHKKNIRSLKGIYFETIIGASGLYVGNVQFYFLKEANVYGIAFSCLAKDLEKNMELFEKTLMSLKEIN